MRAQGIGKATGVKGRDKNLGQWRLKQRGVRLELAVWRDKVPSAKARQAEDFEWNLDELLQAKIIFANAVKSEPIKDADLEKAFEGKKMTNDERLIHILNKGELLASQEDRVQAGAEEAKGLHNIAVLLSKICFSVPPEDEEQGGGKKGKAVKKAKTGAIKVDRFTAEVMERELKNSRFKVTTQRSENDIARDALLAIRKMDSDPKIYRDGRLLTIVADSDESKSVVIPEFAKLECPCWRHIGTEGRTFRFVADSHWVCDEKKLTSVPFGQLTVSQEVYIPKDDSDDLVYTSDPSRKEHSDDESSSAPSRKAAGKKGAGGKKAGKGKKGGAKDDDDDSSSSESETDSDDGLTEIERELKKLQSGDGGAKTQPKKAAAKPAAKAKAKHADPAAAQPKKASKPAKKKDEFASSSSESDGEATIKVKAKKAKKGKKGKRGESDSD